MDVGRTFWVLELAGPGLTHAENYIYGRLMRFKFLKKRAKQLFSPILGLWFFDKTNVTTRY
jgi:hypothetical protein